MSFCIHPCSAMSSFLLSLCLCASQYLCRELYLDGNSLECEGVVELLRLLVRQASIEREERIIEAQRQADEDAQASSLGGVPVDIEPVGGKNE